MVALLMVLALAASPTSRWVALYSNAYQIHVPKGEMKTLALPVPARLAGLDRSMTFTWTVVRPTPAPRFVILEQCVAPEQCYPAILRPDGQGTGSLRTSFRITNRGFQDVDVLFRYTVWEAR